MLFNSLSFLFFFPIAVAGYFYLPFKYKRWWLLVASCVFYMAFIPVYILILFVTIIADYFLSLAMVKASGRRRKILFVLSLIGTLSILFVFKYYNFFAANIDSLAEFLHWNYSLNALKIILPIGLSFHTFQGMSYIIEVYRGRQPVERNFLTYALYVMFFPQLVAGPIERPQNLLPQFTQDHRFDYQRVVNGLQLMAWGLLKKVVIADNLAVFVNAVYGDVYAYNGWNLALATIFFSWQIYCDFSGYSDIAIGAAQVLGYDLMKNFNRPYWSKSFSEFWQRWHISLSSWFKDYVYIPLGGNRVSSARRSFNVLVVFLLSGFWHGANWTFLAWGAVHGLFLIMENTTAHWRAKVGQLIKIDHWLLGYKIIQTTFIFLLVSFAWIFFRANNLTEAFFIIKSIAEWLLSPLTTVTQFSATTKTAVLPYVGLLFLPLLLVVELLQRRHFLRAKISAQTFWVRWPLYWGIVIAIILFAYYNTGPRQFIYFQF